MYQETETLELKKSLAQLKEGVISLSAMLNKHNTGKVIFGINDEGRVCGMTIGDKTKADVIHEIQNNLKPLPNSININQLTIEDKEVLEVEAFGDDTPYCAYGRYYIRINDSDIYMSPSQFQQFFALKQDNYSSWEQKETEYTAEDIDEGLLIDCIRTANENGRLDYVYRNALEDLNKLGLLTKNKKLNNAGLYLFGNNKPLTIKLVDYPTDSRVEFGEIKEFKGNIIECIKEASTYIQNHISFKSEIVGVQREETPEIPLKAIREIVINSFAHCSYAKINDFNQYVVFKSQVKIYNPGSILQNIDPIKFANGAIGSKLRNILISQVLFKYGYIDAFGTGFDRTFTLCAKDNVDYSYYNDEFGFTFIFNRKSSFLTSKKEPSSKPNKLDNLITIILLENKYITIPEIAKKLVNPNQPFIGI